VLTPHIGEHGVTHDSARGRREFSRLEEKRREDADEQDIYPDIRRGWRLGAEDFLDRLKDRIEVAVRDRHEASQVRDKMQVLAHRITEEEPNGKGLS